MNEREKMEKNEEVKQIQNELLCLMKDFHNICKKHRIRYSLHAGTLLGAIREGGFIPWDDDADVSFLRTEYEKFKNVIKTQYEKDQLPFVCDFSFGARLIRQRAGKPIVWLDLYIYDFISENRLIQKLKIAELAFLMAWLRSTEEMYVTKAHGVYQGWKYELIHFIHILGLPFSDYTKLQIANQISQLHKGKKKLIHRANDQFVAIKIILPAKVMYSYQLIQFEDTKLMIAKDYDLILTSSYGSDYMVPRQAYEDAKAHDIYRKIQEKKR
ncbi:MAG: LicD family protein [Lachnospiraceae bacterium]|nr:LicD family protein [Lachnospiraceae bacterium]